MRPHLHPDMGQVVICARVARQYAYVYLRRSTENDLTPSQIAAAAAYFLPPEYPGMFRFALHSLSVYLGLGMTSGQWLKNVLEAAHFGSSFRRCFFFAYKENRSSNPRVTARGLTGSSKRRPPTSNRGARNV